MPEITIHSPAKLNLCLDIIQKLPSGYHEIRSIFHELKTPKDKITIKESTQKDDIETLNADIPKQENLAFKALKLIKQHCKITRFAHITLDKQIPLSSGLGGGSSNAATTLKSLNQLWNLGLSTQELIALAHQLGSDVPFFIHGGTALVEGTGEKITPLPHLNLDITINPPKKWSRDQITPQNPTTSQISLSSNLGSTRKTTNAYAALDLTLTNKNSHLTDLAVQAIQQGDINALKSTLHNDFSQLYPASQSHLTGSGPATFRLK